MHLSNAHLRHDLAQHVFAMLSQAHRSWGTGLKTTFTKQRTGTRHRALHLLINNKLILRPAGDGTTSHLNIRMETPELTEIVLEKNVLEIGREQPADVVIPAPTVSARHALVNISDEGVVTVTDLESTNGTFIDREEIEPMRAQELRVGSQVIFGDEHLANFVLFDEGEKDIVASEKKIN